MSGPRLRVGTQGGGRAIQTMSLRPLPGGTCGAELELAPGQLVDSLTPADAAALRAGLAEHRAVLVRNQGSLPVGGLDALCRLIGGAAYDPREHGAELLMPERSRSYLVTNVADAATGRLREGREVSGSADAGSAGNHQWHTVRTLPLPSPAIAEWGVVSRRTTAGKRR